MQYHVAKNGEKSGPFEKEEIYRRLVSGELSGSDLGWCEGMADWEPLSKLIPPPMSGVAPVFGPAVVNVQVASTPQTSGLAIASMVCGIFSFFLLGLTSLPAIIMGHMARSRIKKSAGTVDGGGMAVAGLITGYLGVLLLGMVILGFLAAAIPDQPDHAQETRTKADIQVISLALLSYQSRTMRLPTTEQGLRALVEVPTIEPIPERWQAFMKEVPKDPWGRVYNYRSPAQRSREGFDLFSAGRDGVDETPDDIGNWKK